MNSDAALIKLLEGWLDGGLTDAEEADLLEQLSGDPELRRRFAEQIAILGATRAAAESNPRWLSLFDLLESDHARQKGDRSFDVVTMDRIGEVRLKRGHGGAIAWGMAAMLALLAGGIFLLKHTQSPALASSAKQEEAAPATNSAIAVVVGSSPGSSFVAGRFLEPGVVAQNEGWLTFQTFRGVSVTLESPFEAVLSSHDRILVNYGRARALVPDGAKGFKLESPSFDVVDLGTEFAVNVNADGTGSCRVFEGMADVSLLDSLGEVKNTQRISSQESVRIKPSSQTITKIEEKDEDYPELKMPSRPRLRLDATYADAVMRLSPVGYWRFEEIANGTIPNSVSGGVLMKTVGTASVTAEEAGNHSGELARRMQTEYFQISTAKDLLQGDFSISLFAQFDWLQNYALISAMRFDQKVQGHPFIMQIYTAYRSASRKETALNVLFRNPPAWDGGIEAHGNSILRPLHWHHMAVTRDDGLVTTYLDGKEIATESIGDMPLDCRQLFIGRLNGNANQSRMEARGLVGRIDELAIFPSALTQEEIRLLAKPVTHKADQKN